VDDAMANGIDVAVPSDHIGERLLRRVIERRQVV
jgi:hypothetical protein